MAKREEEIMRASVKIFAKKGYQDTHIADIVEEVGIAKGTFYLYFKSKKDIFLELIEKHSKILEKDLKDIFLHRQECEDLKTAVKTFLNSFFNSYAKDKELTAVVFREAVSVDVDFQEKLKKLEKAKMDIMSKFYDFLIKKDFGVEEKKFEVFSYMILGIIESYVFKDMVLKNREFKINSIVEDTAEYICKAVSK